MMYKEGFLLVIAGNIGVGKTTFTRLIHESLGWEPLYEQFKSNPYLEDFYKEMPAWGFHSQLHFLVQRFKAQLKIGKSKIPVILDRSIYEDAEVFAKNLYQQGILTERDYATYRDLYETIVELVKPPDLIVYLRASSWTLISRIRKRWRDIERDLNKEYLFQLNLLYEKWILEWKRLHAVEIIETDGRDFLTEKKWTESLIRKIEQYALKNHKKSS